MSVFKQRLHDNFMPNWRDILNNSSRANFYKSAAQFKFQTYLEQINVFKYMQALSKLTMSLHMLVIKSGRWARPTSTPINERKCVHCNVLEDDFHFMIECNIFIEFRTKYYWKRLSMYKFIKLLNTAKVKRNLNVYIYQPFKCCTDLLYGTQASLNIISGSKLVNILFPIGFNMCLDVQ